MSAETKTGVELIAAERTRQIEVENRSPRHDATHRREELAQAAASYAMPPRYRPADGCPPLLWPWHIRWWKPTPTDRVRELVKAGALIAAEIDRLQASS